MSVLIETSLGEIVIDLHTRQCPRTSRNFLKLCAAKYYNFVPFLTVQRGFVAQTGDPTSRGDGGWSAYGLADKKSRYFADEIHPKLKHRQRGTVSMANAGPNLNASQFFITLADNLDYLDGKHTIFGQVSEGFDVLEKLNNVLVDSKNVPYQVIRIRHTIILDDPFDNIPGLVIPDRSPSPSKELLQTLRIEEFETINSDEGKSAEQIEEERKDREAAARTLTLEMMGDIPDAEIKPPENVLFVCKLNPVTTDEDLNLIFSRFGKILSCEVIRDKKTGDSLQYAFIEYDEKEACEMAFMKMQDVLIDDRRIHVDFSQSVSKLFPQYKGKYAPKPAKSRGPKPVFVDDNLALKQRGRTSDDYEMVFDDDQLTAAPLDESDANQPQDVADNKTEEVKEGKEHRTRDSKDDRAANRSKDANRHHEREHAYDRKRDGSRDRHGHLKDIERNRRHDRSRERERDRSRDRNRDRDYRDRSRERTRDRDYRDRSTRDRDDREYDRDRSTRDRDHRDREYDRDRSQERKDAGRDKGSRSPPRRNDDRDGDYHDRKNRDRKDNQDRWSRSR